MPCLELTGPWGQSSVHLLDADESSIGRSAGNDIVLPDPTISRHQAVVYRQDDRWLIRDLGSRNGTSVDRRRIGAPAELLDGTEIQLGNCRAIFFEDDVPPSEMTDSGVTLADLPSLETSVERRAHSLFQQQFDMAREIQSFLLPRSSPQLAGYDIFGESQPCYEVGGDFYDYYRRSDGSLGVFLGDVSRKGFGSAVLSHYTQATIHTAFHYEPDLEQLAARINRDLCFHTADNQFVSAFLGALEPASGVLTYVNAGHCPPLLVRRDGSAEPLPGYNLLLGVVDAAAYAASRVTLEPGDSCLLFSDGIPEYRDSRDELFGDERLSRFFAARPTMAPERILRELEDELERFARGAQPTDDVTLVLLRRLA